MLRKTLCELQFIVHSPSEFQLEHGNHKVILFYSRQQTAWYIHINGLFFCACSHRDQAAELLAEEISRTLAKASKR